MPLSMHQGIEERERLSAQIWPKNLGFVKINLKLKFYREASINKWTEPKHTPPTVMTPNLVKTGRESKDWHRHGRERRMVGGERCGLQSMVEPQRTNKREQKERENERGEQKDKST